jgi:phosphoribosylanthranilate isomerase
VPGARSDEVEERLAGRGVWWGSTGNWLLATGYWFMTWVKICGITNLEDALVAVEAGADAVGFVFYEKSPRFVSVETAREIIAKLPDNVEKIGVFVDADCEQIHTIVGTANLTSVQLHGGRSAESFNQDERPAAECLGASKVIGLAYADGLAEATGVSIRDQVRQRLFAVLVDREINGTSGGTGEKFDWEGCRDMVRCLSLFLPVIVAGGLNASNVRTAMGIFEPFGVDVSSGVEAQPGKKDSEKVRAFLKAVREYDAKVS